MSEATQTPAQQEPTTTTSPETTVVDTNTTGVSTTEASATAAPTTTPEGQAKTGVVQGTPTVEDYKASVERAIDELSRLPWTIIEDMNKPDVPGSYFKVGNIIQRIAAHNVPLASVIDQLNRQGAAGIIQNLFSKAHERYLKNGATAPTVPSNPHSVANQVPTVGTVPTPPATTPPVAKVVAPVVEKVHQLILNDSGLYMTEENELFTEFSKVSNFQVKKVEGKDLPLKWRGAKISYADWQQVSAFLRWSQETHKAESLMWFFYHPKDRRWAVMVPPQKTQGMTVNFNYETWPEGAELWNEQRKVLGRGWRQLGSIHHHCTAGAFQSGTDHKDEIDSDGIHITLGNMESAEYSSHIRCYFKGVEYKVALSDIVEAPAWLQHVPTAMQKSVLEKVLVAQVKDVEFPAQWKENIHKTVYAYQGGTNVPFKGVQVRRIGVPGTGSGTTTGTATGSTKKGSHYHLLFSGTSVGTPGWYMVNDFAKGRNLQSLAAFAMLMRGKVVANNMLTVRAAYLVLQDVAKARKTFVRHGGLTKKLAKRIAGEIEDALDESKASAVAVVAGLRSFMLEDREVNTDGSLIVLNRASSFNMDATEVDMDDIEDDTDDDDFFRGAGAGETASGHEQVYDCDTNLWSDVVRPSGRGGNAVIHT